MNNLRLIIAFSLILFCPLVFSQSSGHADHGGNGGGGASSCLKLKIDQLKPAALSETAPESEFSFTASGIESPDALSVLVKKIPVKVNTEFKDPFFRVKGKLPVELKGTHARIQVLSNAKNPKCNDENGWLIKISD